MKIYCNCTGDKAGNKQAAEFQDKTYGKNIRIGTPKLGNGKPKAACTVCGSVTENIKA